MRIRLLIPFAAFLALAGCSEPKTPKPRLPSTVTAPITQPARPDLTLAPPAAACPPQPVLVCPPVAAPVQARRVKHVKPAARHAAHQGHRHTQGRHHHRHHQDGYPPPPPPLPPPSAQPAQPPQDDRYVEDAHMHAYGQDGAVAHYARPDAPRVPDRYSAGGADQGGTAYARAGCCRPGEEAAGRDANGFLTWPGKVPARP